MRKLFVGFLAQSYSASYNGKDSNSPSSQLIANLFIVGCFLAFLR